MRLLFSMNIDAIDGDTAPQDTDQALFSDAAVVGRAAEVDFQVDDRSVSRRHLSVQATPAGFRVRSLTERGSTFINGQPLEAGGEVAVDESPAWIQVGRVLLRVARIHEQTVSWGSPMPLPSQALAPRPISSGLLRVTRRPVLQVWVGAQALQAYPSATRVLARLCQSPGEVVPREELVALLDPNFEQRAGGLNLHQTMTYVRDALEAALDQGWLLEAELAAQVRRCAPELGEDADRRALLRTLVANVRRVGYRLNLPADVVEIEEAG